MKFLRVFQNSINWLESIGFIDGFLPFPKVRKLKVCCVSVPEAGHLVPTVQVGCAETRGKDEATSKAFIFFVFRWGFFFKTSGYLKGSQLNDGISTMSFRSQSF